MRTGPHGVGCRGAPACAGGAGSRNCSTEDIDRPTWWAYSAPLRRTLVEKPGQLYVHVCVDHEAERAPASPVRSRVGRFPLRNGNMRRPTPAPPTASRAGQPSVLPFSNAPRCASSVLSHRIGSWFLPSFEPSPLPTRTRMAYVEVRADECPETAVGLRAAQHQPPNAQRRRTWLARTATPRATEPVATPGRRWGRRWRGSAHAGMPPWPGSRCRGE